MNPLYDNSEMSQDPDDALVLAQIQRIKNIMRDKGYPAPTSFASAAGISPSTLNRKLSGTDKSLISSRTWAKLQNARPAPGHRADVYDIDQRYEDEMSQTEVPGMVHVAEVDVVSSAGGGAVVDSEDDNGTWGFPASFVQSELRASPADIRIITNEGDSMISDPPKPTDIQPGDKLVVRISDRTPSPPGIFIVHDGLGLVTKRVVLVDQSDPPTIRFLSNNPNYEPYERTLEEAHIMGRVIGRWQRF